jgi:hypothetical protein
MKLKLIIGTVFLFLELIVITIFSAYCINQISLRSKIIFNENNLSLSYAKQMQQTIEKINLMNIEKVLYPKDKIDNIEFQNLNNKFESIIQMESSNITENGEKEAVQAIADMYNSYKEYNKSAQNKNIHEYYRIIQPIYNNISKEISMIYEINYNAVIIKNKNIEHLVNHSYIVLSIIGTIFLLVSFVLVINLPSIVNPVKNIRNKLVKIMYILDIKNSKHYNDDIKQIDEYLEELITKIEDTTPK